MSISVNALAIAVLTAAAIFCGWRGARKWDPARSEPRLIPWRPLMVAFTVAALLLLVHLVNLSGVSTGYRR